MPTTYQPDEVPAWPAYAFVVRGSGQVAVSGPLLPACEHPSRTSAVDAVAAAAAGLGRPVRAEATEPDGTVWHLVISPDGAVGELSGGAPRGRAPKKRNAPTPAPAPAPDPEPEPDPVVAAAPSATPSPAPASPGGLPVASDALTEGVSQLETHAAAGRMDQATALAAQLDQHAADSLGLSHPDALRTREVRARITALAGDPVGAVRLYRDIAERWHYQGADDQAEAVASRAHALWLEIPDLETAIAAGVAMVRMRNQIPGENGTAFAATLQHQTWLEAARNATVQSAAAG
ncbi:hypothetical protein [Streptomyces sp. RK75]|uniref:hypothetical protein n=1 Tax=Streptomyces sp. RK75 TaxID=2824895 RepID=UPI001B368FA1|nr:hypothetical protein [Streptomyces sp. RK75]MBQ0862787.1 hypothetical protein [Streptomyces sp. RK75]